MNSLRRILERIPPPVWFLVCVLTGLALDRVRPLPLGSGLSSARLELALGLLAAVAALGIWALRGFLRARTTPKPFGTPTALLVDGPYRFSRNPLYVTLVVAGIAFGVLLDTLWILALVPLLAAALDRLIIPAEEAQLEQLFGDTYRTYRRRVRRWL